MTTFCYGEDYLTTGKALHILNGAIKGVILPETRQKIQSSFHQVHTIARGEKAVYGINTGFGPLCNTIISKNKTSELQKKLLLSHSVGVGNKLKKPLSKMMLILKVHALARGYSGIAPHVLDRILWHIEEDIIPLVPEQGSVGASGDLAPLAHLFLPLIGEGKVIVKDKIVASSTFLQKKGLLPLELGPKSGLALINGTQFIAAHAIFVLDNFYNCLAHADLAAAMMIDGLKGSKAPFSSQLHQTRPFRGNIHVAHNIDRLLDGSQIMESHKDCDKVQDPYSLRCVPQVHGASRNAWLHLKETLEIELNSVTDNPVVFPDGQTISGGNFHGQPLALPLDYACLALAELGNISDRRSYLSLEGKTEGIPKLLMQNAGLNSGFMIVQYTSAALTSENKGLCFPASADSIPTSLGQEDHVSMGSIGSRKALKVSENLIKILAIEFMCAAQILDFHRPLRSGPLIEKIHSAIREKVKFAKEDRIFSDDIHQIIDLIKSKRLIQICQIKEPGKNQVLHSLFEEY